MALSNPAPDNIDTMLLLPDGTVMATAGDNGYGSGWYRLTPDSHGSYVNGTWTTLTPMNYSRLYYASQVLKNGNVLVAGGEYGTGTNTAEVYNPQLNTWTVTPPPPAGQILFYDNISETISNGNILVSPVVPAVYGGTDIYNILSGTWSSGPTLYRGGYQDEASWVKLPDNSILTIDPFGTNSERYIPTLNQWVNDATVPVQIYDSVNFEMGPAFLLTNGTAIFPGATGNTAIYTPSGSTSPGTWTAGPVLPNSLVMADNPGAMMVNGKFLFTMSATTNSIYGPPTYFYEYDTGANSFTQVNGPTGPTFNEVSYPMRMLDLPDGTVLLSTSNPQLYVYQPGGTPLAAGRPTISNLSTNGDGSLHLTGTLFNGISEGAAYGDDAQMNSNYPLVRMTNSVSGLVYYARTYNWSSSSVMTGTNIVSTDFVLPAFLPQGIYSLVVSANGNASAPMTFVYSSDALQISSNNLAFNGTIGGPFTPASISFTLTNLGPTSLNWAVGKTASWLNLSPSNGVLAPGGSTATIAASLNTSANALALGTYASTLLFTNLSDHAVQSRIVALQVNAPQLVQNGGFETGDFTDWGLNDQANIVNLVTNFNFTYADFGQHSGNYAAYMGESGYLADLSQTNLTAIGQLYLFSSWVNSPDTNYPSECSISWNGTVLFDQTNMPPIGWTNLAFFVTATRTNTVIQFGFRDDNSYMGLDDVSVIPAPAPTFTSVANSGNSINLTWSATPGLTYQLLYATNLTSGTWLNVGGPITATGSTVNTTDPSPSSPRRFYRVMLVP